MFTQKWEVTIYTAVLSCGCLLEPLFIVHVNQDNEHENPGGNESMDKSVLDGPARAGTVGAQKSANRLGQGPTFAHKQCTISKRPGPGG